MDGMTSFETALGRCALRWSEAGITRVLLPSGSGPPDPAVHGTVPAFVRRAIEGMTAVLAGVDDDLRDVPVDHRSLDPFRPARPAVMATLPGRSATDRRRRATSALPWPATRPRSSSRAIAWWPPTAG
jgi:methylated-DNA-[protein]-cysteine S-methyltransferase